MKSAWQSVAILHSMGRPFGSSGVFNIYDDFSYQALPLMYFIDYPFVAQLVIFAFGAAAVGLADMDVG